MKAAFMSTPGRAKKIIAVVWITAAVLAIPSGLIAVSKIIPSALLFESKHMPITLISVSKHILTGVSEKAFTQQIYISK